MSSSSAAVGWPAPRSTTRGSSAFKPRHWRTCSAPRRRAQRRIGRSSSVRPRPPAAVRSRAGFRPRARVLGRPTRASRGRARRSAGARGAGRCAGPPAPRAAARRPMVGQYDRAGRRLTLHVRSVRRAAHDRHRRRSAATSRAPRTIPSVHCRAALPQPHRRARPTRRPRRTGASTTARRRSRGGRSASTSATCTTGPAGRVRLQGPGLLDHRHDRDAPGEPRAPEAGTRRASTTKRAQGRISGTLRRGCCSERWRDASER